MVEFNENIPNGLPKLPVDYWTKAETNQLQENTSILANLLASLEDISVFNKKKV